MKDETQTMDMKPFTEASYEEDQRMVKRLHNILKDNEEDKMKQLEAMKKQNITLKYLKRLLDDKSKELEAMKKQNNELNITMAIWKSIMRRFGSGRL